MAILDISKLNLNFGAKSVLEELTFAVEQGEFLTVLGPNGSGKSTLVKLLSKTLLPTAGSIYFSGEELANCSTAFIAKQMAVVPQETAVNFSFTVQEVVMMGRYPHLKRFQSESHQDYQVVREAMLITKTWDLRHRPVNQLSGGERQRVIIARALAQEPSVILLDEPISHLDITFQVELLELLADLNRTKGVTVIIVLHDLNLAAQYSQKVMLIKNGRIFVMGEPEQVITAANIQDVYGTEVIVWPHPVKNCPQISVVGKERKVTPEVEPLRVHLICGGGVGIGLMNELAGLGYQLSAGVLNIGDSDWVHAKRLGIKMVEEAPYSPISDQAYLAAEQLIDSVDVVVLLDIPMGPGNLKNIQLAQQAVGKGITTYLVAQGMEARDYTNGTGSELIDNLSRQGAHLLQQGSALLEHLKQNLQQVAN